MNRIDLGERTDAEAVGGLVALAGMAVVDVGCGPGLIARDRIETDEVRALFERGRSADGDYVFDQPLLLNLYRGPR